MRAQFDATSSTKNLKTIFSQQSTLIDQLSAERDELVDRVESLEQQLANTMSMVSLQKQRISNLSALSSNLSSFSETSRDIKITNVREPLTFEDKLTVDQISKLDQNQIPLYLAHNPDPLIRFCNSTADSGRRTSGILHALAPKVAVEYATAAFKQIYRASEVNCLVGQLRKIIYNEQFVQKIEEFCCGLFSSRFCRVFLYQAQQNQFITAIENGYIVQVPSDRGLIGECAKKGNVINISSTKDYEFYEPEIDDFFNVGHAPSMLIPIMDSSSNYVNAVIHIYSPTVAEVYTHEDVLIGEMLSQSISPFVTSYSEQEEKNGEKMFRTEVSQAIRSLLGKDSYEELIPTTTSAVMKAIKAGNSEMFLWEEKTKVLYAFEDVTNPEGERKYVRKYFTSKSGIPFHVIETQVAYNIGRLTVDKCEFFSRETDIGGLGMSYVAVPIFGSDKRVMGVLTAYGKEDSNQFSPLDVSALQQIGIQIGVNLMNINALERTRDGMEGEKKEGNSFERPLLKLQGYLNEVSENTKIGLCMSIGQEMRKRMKCDMIGIWEVEGERIEQRYIQKGKVPMGMIEVPKIVEESVGGKGEIISVASDIKRVFGRFDETNNYKTYSLLICPIKGNWVIVGGNSLSVDGRFSEEDMETVRKYSSLLMCVTEIGNKKKRSEEVKSVVNGYQMMKDEIVPYKEGISGRVMVGVMGLVGAMFYGVYKVDEGAESMGLMESNVENAPKSGNLGEGISGKAYARGDVVCVDDLNEAEGKVGLDVLGLESAKSGMYIRIPNDVLIVLLTGKTDGMDKRGGEVVKEIGWVISHVYEVERMNMAKGGEGREQITQDERGMYMKKASVPSRGDIDEYSDRMLNIRKYSGEEQMVMILKMFVSQGVIRKLQVPLPKLVQYLFTLRGHYNEVRYHNWEHAVDSMQFVFSCIMRGRLRLFLQDIEIFALMMAAISHDVDHQGLMNGYHKRMETPLGILYGDKSVMEMHHAATAIAILSRPECNVIDGIEGYGEQVHFWKFFIKIILATDMDHHFEYIKAFEEIQKDFDKRNEEHRLLLAEIVMKVGNVSNTMRVFEVASEMAQGLTEEYFKQGDVEERLGGEVTGICDRQRAQHISISQVNFYNLIAGPLVTSLGTFLPALGDNMDQMEKNKRMWEQQKVQWESTHRK